MVSDFTRTLSEQVRVIFPDGLPRGFDPSQEVQLVVRNPKRESPDAPSANRAATIMERQRMTEPPAPNRTAIVMEP
jgi:hypothetical protein